MRQQRMAFAVPSIDHQAPSSCRTLAAIAAAVRAVSAFLWVFGFERLEHLLHKPEVCLRRRHYLVVGPSNRDLMFLAENCH